MSGAVQVTEEIAAKPITSRAKVKNATVADLVLVPAEPVEQPARALVDIERDLAPLVKAQRRNIFTMGALLIEAKAQVLHGDWLPWLRTHFQNRESTANNYMAAARYLVKNPTVGDLKLSDGAIYWLASGVRRVGEDQRPWLERHPRIVAPEMLQLAIADILETAKHTYVDGAYCRATLETYWKKSVAAQAAETRAVNKAGFAEHGDRWVPRQASNDCRERIGDPGHVMTAEEQEEAANAPAVKAANEQQQQQARDQQKEQNRVEREAKRLATLTEHGTTPEIEAQYTDKDERARRSQLRGMVRVILDYSKMGDAAALKGAVGSDRLLEAASFLTDLAGAHKPDFE